jgi:hypothetical protein
MACSLRCLLQWPTVRTVVRTTFHVPRALQQACRCAAPRRRAVLEAAPVVLAPLLAAEAVAVEVVVAAVVVALDGNTRAIVVGQSNNSMNVLHNVRDMYS